jgi:hypothetical protein
LIAIRDLSAERQRSTRASSWASVVQSLPPAKKPRSTRWVSFGASSGKEMAAVDAVAGDDLGAFAPDGEHVVADALRAALAPQDKERHRELVVAVGTVVFEIDRGTGAVLRANRADRLRIFEAAQIFGKGVAAFWSTVPKR